MAGLMYVHSTAFFTSTLNGIFCLRKRAVTTKKSYDKKKRFLVAKTQVFRRRIRNVFTQHKVRL